MRQGNIRIIGGQWRGRKLKVPDVADLRPTPDRVRETLFNWLTPFIHGTYCLDLFAGSGALGFEALSRGASHVVMVDHSAQVIALLQQESAMLKTNQVDMYCATIPDGLKPTSKPFDIVFLDPPYPLNIVLPCCFYLEKHGFLADPAHIYLEAKTPIQPTDLPTNWHMIKNKKAGQVAYHLVQRKREK